MFKQHRRNYNLACFLSDVLMLVASFFLAYFVRGNVLPAYFPGLSELLFPPEWYLPVLLLAALVTIGALFAAEAYRQPPTLPASMTFVLVAKAVLIAALCSLALAYVFRLTWLSRIFLGLLMAQFLFLSVLGRAALSLWYQHSAQRGKTRRMIVLVGSNARAQEIVRRIQRHPELGLQLRGFFEFEAAYDPEDVQAMQHLGIPYLGDTSGLGDFIRGEVVDGVVFAVDSQRLERLEDLFLQCEELGIDTMILATLFPHLSAQVRLERLDEFPILRFTTVPQKHVALFVKRLIDIAGSAAGLILLAPLFAVVAAAVRISSPGPIFFVQERSTLNGRRFRLFKFRTMIADAERRREELQELNEADGPAFKIRNDPRITGLGRFLRKTSIDELPQLWNVLKGEMSLVGPRPPIPAEVEEYEPWQRRRLSMRPGITCLWQISGRSELDFDTWMRLDLRYIDQWSLGLDFAILLRTIPAVLSTRGAA